LTALASTMEGAPPVKRYRTAVADNGRWAGFTPCPGDVFVCTPAKCGTTWMQTIVASLLWPDGDVPGPVLEISPWLEAEFDPIDEILGRLAAQRYRRFRCRRVARRSAPSIASSRAARRASSSNHAAGYPARRGC